MKRFLSVLVLFVFLFLSCKTAKQSVEEKKPELKFQENGLAVLNIENPLMLEAYKTEFTGDGTFHDAPFIARDMKLGLNIGNTMEAYKAKGCEQISFTWIPVIGENTPSDYETCWKSPVITQEMIDAVKTSGFNTVRIPVFWGNMMINDGSWTINSEYLARVREIVDYCLNNDLYAVVNCHHFDEFIIRRNSIDDCALIFENLWTQIASYFNNYSEKLIFEGFNEYLGGSQFNASGYLQDLRRDVAYELVNKMNDTFVKAVRSTGGNNLNRVLIISGYWTNIDRTTNSAFIIPEDTVENRLMVSVHYVDNSMYWSNQIGGPAWEKYIEYQCGLLKKAFTSRNIPVFLGETTAGYPSPNMSYDASRTSSECVEYVLKRLLDYGFVPVIWDTHSDHSFFDRNEMRIRLEENQEVISRVNQLLLQE